MADQAATGQAATGTLRTGTAGAGAVPGSQHGHGALGPDAAGTPGNYEPYHGRTVSWVAVAIIMAGFLAGGLALVFGPTWWLFWTGGAFAAIGGLLALSTNIFEDWY
jgi:hypothetical protein